VAGVQPLLGRPLLEEDERQGAPHVLVIGRAVWIARFASDPAVIGRRVRLGNTNYAVVGVMPEGFAFPVNHSFWVPLRIDAAHYDRRSGPAIMVFGRLSSGATLESAQAEAAGLGHRAALAFPHTHEHLQPQVLSYTRPFVDMDAPENSLTLAFVQVLVVALLALVAVNVAILVYARTATRLPEIAIRSALGAGRSRIIGQLFLEALVLAASAAAAGLALTALALRQLDAALLAIRNDLPFWIDFGLSPITVAYVVGLAVLAAAIVGVMPALTATGRRVQPGLRLIESGCSGMQLGRTWTVLIVAQVGFAVAVLPGVVFQGWETMRHGFADPDSAAAEFLTARLTYASSPPAHAPMDSREHPGFARSAAELMRRLKTEGGVDGATFTLVVPGEEPTAWIEAEGIPMPPESRRETSGYAVRDGTFGHEVRFNHVGSDFFETFRAPVLTGRAFAVEDSVSGSGAVIVNRSFAQEIFGGREVLGRRLRYIGRSGDARPEDIEFGRWYEVVGVVGDLADTADLGLVNAKVYHLTAPGQIHPMSLVLRMREAEPGSFAGRLREISAAVDPNIQLRDVLGLIDVLREQQGLLRLVAATLGLSTLSVVLLSAAGIYALMSFAVAQRRKEIGIRAALGADARHLVTSIFSRAAGQLALGAILGMLTVLLAERATGGDLMRGRTAIVIPIVSLLMLVVGLLATLGPARRGLRIDPTEALREP
jgi:predicted permease